MHTIPRLAALTVAAALVCGCAKDPAKAVPAAKVADKAKPADKAAPKAAAEAKPAAAKPAADKPAEPATAKPAAAPTAKPAAPAGAVALSGDVIFIGSKVTGSHENKFTKWTGNFTLAEGKAEGGKLAFEVDTAEIKADYKSPSPWSGKLEKHLKGPDFFDVAKHPKATFASSEIKAGGAEGATHTVKGTLTIRGVAKEVSFPATIKVEGGKVSAKTEFSINRKDFGIEYKGKPDDLIRDGVVLKIDVHS